MSAGSSSDILGIVFSVINFQKPGLPGYFNFPVDISSFLIVISVFPI